MTADGLRVVDTNIVIRLIVRDDANQLVAIEALLENSVFVPLTVLLETVWVLSSRYRLGRQDIAEALLQVFDLPSVRVEAPDLVPWAIARFRAGADFNDLIHLIAARNGEAFLTFDRDVARRVEDGAPLPIVTLST